MVRHDRLGAHGTWRDGGKGIFVWQIPPFATLGRKDTGWMWGRMRGFPSVLCGQTLMY